MKEAKKMQVNDQICKQVQLMLKGGAKQSEVGQLLGLHPSTVSKIAKAGFSVEKYLENKKAEREKKQAEEPKAAEEQVAGQIAMDLTPEKPEMSDQTKMMRFQAAQVDKLYMKLEKINDTLCQILRAIRKE